MRYLIPAATLLLLTQIARAAADLPNPYRDTPPERNGWTLLVEACGLVTSEDANRPALAWAYPDPWQPTRPGVVRHVEINAPALAKLDQALARPEIVPPTSAANWEGGSRHAKLRELARLKVQRAYLRREQGDLLGALRDLDDLLTYTDRRDDSACSLIDYLVTRAIGSIGLSGVRQVLGPPPAYLDPAIIAPTDLWPVLPYSPAERAALEALARHVGDESRCLPALRSAFGGEVVVDGNDLRRSDNHQGPLPSEADIAQVLGYGHDLLSAHLAITARPPWQRDWRGPRAVRRPACMDTDDALAQFLGFGERFWSSMANKVDGDRAIRRMTALAIALRLFAADHQRLPSRLDELVAGRYLPAVPLDPYDGQPIRYRPRAGLLYCLSRDRRDQGGDWPDDYPARLDFVRTPPMPPPPGAAPPDRDDNQPERWAREPMWHGDGSLF